VDNPIQYREHERADECGHESTDDESGDNCRHRPKEERIQDEREEAERDDRNGEREDGEDGLNDHCDDRPYQRDKKNGE